MHIVYKIKKHMFLPPLSAQLQLYKILKIMPSSSQQSANHEAESHGNQGSRNSLPAIQRHPGSLQSRFYPKEQRKIVLTES